MRLKLGLVVGALTVLALAGGSSAALATDDPAKSGTSSSEAGEPGPSLGIAAERPLTQADAEKFAKCVRASGIPGFKTPEVSDGKIESALPRNVDPEVVRKATEKCAPGGAPRKVKLSPAEVKKLKRYAKCMRENGVENFPTPSSDGSLRLTDGIDPESDEFQAAEEACKKYQPRRVGKRTLHSGDGAPTADGSVVLHAAA